MLFICGYSLFYLFDLNSICYAYKFSISITLDIIDQSRVFISCACCDESFIHI